MPGAVALLDGRRDARAVAEAVIGDAVHTLCVNAAERVEVPAPPPQLRTNADVAETFLARLDGSMLRAPPCARPVSSPAGSSSGRGRSRAPPTSPSSSSWTRPTTAAPGTCRCWPPATAGGSGRSRARWSPPRPSARADVQRQLARLERLFPELLRPGGRRRGEVLLSQDEAWRLMTVTGDLLVRRRLRRPGAGALRRKARRRPSASPRRTPRARWSARRQLANVRWSALFDDVELSAEEIARLARQARPLVQSRGRWIELDRADLAAAAAALAERADKTRLTGADMLRHVLGLEGSPLAGGISLAGEGWAADLLRSASELKTDLVTRPEGFVASCVATRPRRSPGCASSRAPASAAASPSTWGSARPR